MGMITNMELSYNTIKEATMTLSQCNDMYAKDMATMGIFMIVIVLLIGIGLLINLYQNREMAGFIKNERLQEKFQKYKQNNKGLM